MTEHYTILTDKGASKIAEAIRVGQKIEITQMALGDGDGSLPKPQSNATSLVKERYRASINSAKVDEHNNAWVIFEQVLAPDIGGWWIREVGLYDKDGDLIAIGNYPEQYKPLLTEGASTTQTVSIVIQVLSSDAITLKVDPSVVLATRQYVDDICNKIKNEFNDSISNYSAHFSSETTSDGEVVHVKNHNSGIKIGAGFVEIDTDGKNSLVINQYGRLFTRGALELFDEKSGTPFIDFHFENNKDQDYSSRIIADKYQHLTITGSLSVDGEITSPSISGVVGKWTSNDKYERLLGNENELLTTRQFCDYKNNMCTPRALHSYILARTETAESHKEGDMVSGDKLYQCALSGDTNPTFSTLGQGTWRLMGNVYEGPSMSCWGSLWCRVA